MCSTPHTDLGLTDANASCSCSTHDHAHESDAVAASAVSTDVLVEGMTCSHCVASVTEEISSLDGVAGVSVDLQPGGHSRVTVSSAGPISEESIRAAVAEAGYTVASNAS